ncbi:MAG TPA: hypothetical protein PKD78_07530, partial [Saprospiraceae bacterium]|nr:hypothetical protein [Saprospiraceae bacterium]
MKHFKIFFLHFLLLLGMLQGLSAQHTVVTDRVNEDSDRAPLSRIKKAADEAMREGDHYSAMRYYRRLLRFDSTNVPVLRNYIEAATEFSAYDSAAWGCQRLIALNELGADALPVLRLAEL